uniref:TTF-type domain-containing protein n=1 Tax=Strongyloides stercoralis TaxID=6248 RepID=A0AAF5DML3_STRER
LELTIFSNCKHYLETVFFSAMKRRYESGAVKRKKMREKEEYEKKLKNSLEKYIICSKKQSNKENEIERISEQADNETEQSATSKANIIINEQNSQEKLRQPNELTEYSGKHKDNCVFFNDIALWPLNLTDKMIQYHLINKPCSVGDITTLKVKYEDRNRSYYRNVSDSNFYCVKANGTKELRQWLIYSETSKCIYCYVCKLFSNVQTKFSIGFNDWKNIAKHLRDHETSQGHMKAMLTLQKLSLTAGRIDTHLVQQIESEQKYWRAFLQRIIATVKLLASLGIAFRGHREDTNSNRRGNFLSCIEYLSEFDSFLKVHLQKYSNPGVGKVNYLSHRVCDEFISLMGNEVKKYLVSEVHQAVYYSIIVDSTPDISHVDQLTCILRFVDKNGNIKERFFGFISIENHNSEYLKEIILEFLKESLIDINHCRGQSYDNAANMSGKYNRLQKRIKEHATTATYVPCSSHTLNLIGNCAAEACIGALKYFDFVQNLFVYFSASTRRWNILVNSMKEQTPHIKRISVTRWASRADAVSALKCNYQNIKEVLIQISKTDSEKPISRRQKNWLNFSTIMKQHC